MWSWFKSLRSKSIKTEKDPEQLLREAHEDAEAESYLMHHRGGSMRKKTLIERLINSSPYNSNSMRGLITRRIWESRDGWSDEDKKSL